MSSTVYPIGPFSAVYVGLTGQASALTLLTSVRTGGGTFTEDLPTEYISSIDATVQTGNHTAEIQTTFIGSADEITCLVRGLPPGSDINSNIGQTQYAMLFIGPGLSDNYYLPQVRVTKRYTRNYGKTSPTTTPVIITAEKRDATITIFTKGNLAKIQTAMGSQYPL